MERSRGFLVSCIGGAFGCALLFEFALFLYSLTAWNEPGRVTVRGTGPMLELHGAPGDTVRLTLPIPADRDADYRELSAELRSQSPPSEATLLPLNASVELSDSEAVAVRATLVVPDLPVGTHANGKLFGKVRSSDGETDTLNVPLTLRVLAPGEGAASGTRDMRFHRFRLVVWNLLLVLAGASLIALACAVEAREGRRERQEEAV